ncbi:MULTISPECIES: fasciclin domain-containing protein [Candidatus Methylopumilus]|jgi:uncharacterized surface protein with fasciclin (FAS1) repeats|uniref:fasciclin domain-containing protein n=1 Tax=Candidatus Methylopumilus TaxID=1679002 RepID=UPI00111D05A5|nr:fasciclin domain-containing protein [Candidatus Methylopumilus universalis]QDC96188.1 fasciclin domain-containing protein [Candidatus Methylopumilus universalis]
MKRTLASMLVGSIFAISSLTAFAAKDIVDTAVAAGNFKTLVVALKTADLVNTLKGKGPYTVFAPTDEAFAKIPKADLDALLANKEKLSAVLTYHVLPGKVMAKDVKAGDVATVNGKTIKITTSNGVVVNMSKVTATDIDTSNGVIHVIDSVLMPK